MDDAEQTKLNEFVENWKDSQTRNKEAFLRIKEHLETKADARLAFKDRPGVTYSLRGDRPGQERDLFVMADVIDDDPENRWLSVCFFGEMINDPDELGDLIPGGLLGEDGYCFDIDEYEEDLVQYVMTRIDEAYDAAGK